MSQVYCVRRNCDPTSDIYQLSIHMLTGRACSGLHVALYLEASKQTFLINNQPQAMVTIKYVNNNVSAPAEP